MSKSVNLFIDTSVSRCNLAIFNNNTIIKKSSCLTHNNLTDMVVEKIHNLIKGYEIENIYITIGPGSFTGERVSCLIAKSWMLIRKINVYIIDSLTFQLPQLNGISLIDAKSKKMYLSIYKNNKCILKPCILSNDQCETILKKHKTLPKYQDYQSINIFKNLFTHLNNFKKVSSYEEITPLYLKKAIYDQKN